MNVSTRAREDQDALQSYLESIGRIPLLTKEEEVELAIAIEKCHEAIDDLKRSDLSAADRRRLQTDVRRGQRARQKFISSNLRLVVNIAKRYQGQGLPLLDLVQEGNMGLIRAVEKFEWRKGFKFSTYATWWIRQAIQRGVGNTARAIRLPVHVEGDYRRVRRAQSELEQSLGRMPAEAEIGKRVKLSPERVADLLSLRGVAQPVSLQETLGEEGTEILELLEDETVDAAFDAVDQSLVREGIEAAMEERLDEREAQVIVLRFGLDDGTPKSLQEVGAVLGLSRERIRQIEARALERLRRESRLSA